jgi:cytochrome b561
MLALPLSGWLYNSAAGFPLRWFNLINLPALLGADPTLKVLLKAAHSAAAIIFMTVIGLHGAAALKHHWMDRDQTLRRMLPW